MRQLTVHGVCLSLSVPHHRSVHLLSRQNSPADNGERVPGEVHPNGVPLPQLAGLRSPLTEEPAHSIFPRLCRRRVTSRRLVTREKDEIRPERRDDSDAQSAPRTEKLGRLGSGIELFITQRCGVGGQRHGSGRLDGGCD